MNLKYYLKSDKIICTKIFIAVSMVIHFKISGDFDGTRLTWTMNCLIIPICKFELEEDIKRILTYFNVRIYVKLNDFHPLKYIIFKSNRLGKVTIHAYKAS